MYTLELTEQDIETILFSGFRYDWSSKLLDHCDVGKNELSESTMWEIVEAFEKNDLSFPLLDHRSELYNKLIRFYNEVV